MRKGQIIKGYEILENSTPAGGRGGVSFAKKDGTEYFIKVFLSPKYPVEGSPGSPETLVDKKKRCKQFEEHHKNINEKISTKCGLGGNLVYAIDFFREGSCYYKVNEKIDISSLKVEDIAKLSKDKILIILKTVAFSLRILHEEHIVHGDLKPDNILIKKTETGNYTAKLIDFDDSYFSKKPPVSIEIVGTPEYYSPELLEYVKGKGDECIMTESSDIFTLGIIFYEYLCGSKPEFPKKYKSVAEYVADGNEVKIGNLPVKIKKLISSMLLKDIEKRPNIEKVFETLKSPGILESDESKSITEPIIKPDETPSSIKISGNLIGKTPSHSTPDNPKIRFSSNLKK